MKRIVLFISIMSGVALLHAQNTIFIHNNDGTKQSAGITSVDSITFSAGMNNLYLFRQGVKLDFSVAAIDSIVFGRLAPADTTGQDTAAAQDSMLVYVDYQHEKAVVTHCLTSPKFSVAVSGAHVSIVSTMGLAGMKFYLSGSTPDGSFSLDNDAKYELVLNGVSISSATTVPIKLGKKTARTITLANGTVSTLTDSNSSDGKAVINTKGPTTIGGGGTLVVNANKKNGISSDYDITVSGGNLMVNVTADAGKGIKADGNISITGGNITVTPSGSLTMDSVGLGFDPSYCTGIGADGNVSISGGTVDITLPASNKAGRGIKADGHIHVTGGSITVVSHSDGGTYKDSTGTVDSYKSSCIKADSNILFTAGTLDLTATGSGGKCVSADGIICFGQPNGKDSDLLFTAKTTGTKFLVSGSGMNADYSNPKAVKAMGNLYVYSGLLNISTANDGGEGLESKDTLFVRGGTNIINTYDDGLNAKNHLQIEGGTTYAHATNNDGMDANGTITVTGGLTIAIGSQSPEEGFDCDQNTFKITGGIMVGIGGATSTPTASACTQRALIFKSLTSGTALCITNASGTEILTFKVPTISGGGGGFPGGGGGPGGGGPGGGSGKLTLLFSSPDLTTGSCSIRQGGSISGGTDFNGYCTGATYTGGTATNVTISGMVTQK